MRSSHAGTDESRPACTVTDETSPDFAATPSAQPAAATAHSSGLATAATVARPGGAAAGTAACSCCPAVWKRRYGLTPSSDGGAVWTASVPLQQSPLASCGGARDGGSLCAAGSELESGGSRTLGALAVSLASPLPDGIGSLRHTQCLSVWQHAAGIRRTPCRQLAASCECSGHALHTDKF